MIHPMEALTRMALRRGDVKDPSMDGDSRCRPLNHQLVELLVRVSPAATAKSIDVSASAGAAHIAQADVAMSDGTSFSLFIECPTVVDEERARHLAKDVGDVIRVQQYIRAAQMNTKKL